MTRFNIHGPGFTLFLALLTALPALSIDMALPSLSLIQAEFDAPQTEAASAIAIFIAGFSSAPIVVGPLADRFGRKAIMTIGLALFTLCAAGSALAPSIHALLAFRLVQGAGAGAIGILPRAIIRDLFEGREARLQLSAVSVVFGVAPLIAPTVGAEILSFVSWRLIFVRHHDRRHYAVRGIPCAGKPAKSQARDRFRGIQTGVDQSRMRRLFSAGRPRVRGSLCLRQCFAAPVHAGLWRIENRIRGSVRHYRVRRDCRLLGQRVVAQSPCQGEDGARRRPGARLRNGADAPGTRPWGGRVGPYRRHTGDGFHFGVRPRFSERGPRSDPSTTGDRRPRLRIRHHDPNVVRSAWRRHLGRPLPGRLADSAWRDHERRGAQRWCALRLLAAKTSGGVRAWRPPFGLGRQVSTQKTGRTGAILRAGVSGNITFRDYLNFLCGWRALGRKPFFTIPS